MNFMFIPLVYSKIRYAFEPIAYKLQKLCNQKNIPGPIVKRTQNRWVLDKGEKYTTRDFIEFELPVRGIDVDRVKSAVSNKTWKYISEQYFSLQKGDKTGKLFILYSLLLIYHCAAQYKVQISYHIANSELTVVNASVDDHPITYYYRKK